MRKKFTSSASFPSVTIIFMYYSIIKFLICIVKCFEIFVMPEREKKIFFHQILAGRD